MAEHKYGLGENMMLLFIDPSGGTTYSTVVCLTSVSPSDSVNVVDAGSACGPDKQVGTADYSIAFEGIHLSDPATGKISGVDIRNLLRAKTLIGFKIAPATPVTGDEVETGTGWITELSSSYAHDANATFSGTLTPKGASTITITT